MNNVIQFPVSRQVVRRVAPAISEACQRGSHHACSGTYKRWHCDGRAGEVVPCECSHHHNGRPGGAA